MMPEMERRTHSEPRPQGAILDGGLSQPGDRSSADTGSETLTLLRRQIAQRDRKIAELEARNAELERYAYVVSHDLKAPLVTIKGFASFLRRDLQTGDQEKIGHDLERISSAADRMHRLLDALLELGRVGRVGNPPRQTEFTEIVNDSIRRLAEPIQKCGAKVLVEPSLPEVFGDASLLTDMLEQLLDNALKHMGPQTAPCIEIGSRRSSSSAPPQGHPPKDCISQEPGPAFYVRDNGPGIHPRFYDRVFQLFERLDPEASDGTGVGLTLVKRIVELHGGSIWIESSGQGSTMCFTLPMTRPDSESPDSTECSSQG